jgi:hypothetical protein
MDVNGTFPVFARRSRVHWSAYCTNGDLQSVPRADAALQIRVGVSRQTVEDPHVELHETSRCQRSHFPKGVEALGEVMGSGDWCREMTNDLVGLEQQDWK